MRRDYFTLDIRNLDGTGEPPALGIDFTGPTGQLTDRLTDEAGDFLAPEDIDIAYRLHGPVNDPETGGVVAITNRVTGEFILELNADARDVIRFVDAARDYGNATEDETRFLVSVSVEGEPLVEFEQTTLLVYDTEGGLLRQQSLIPSGVEL